MTGEQLASSVANRGLVRPALAKFKGREVSAAESGSAPRGGGVMGNIRGWGGGQQSFWGGEVGQRWEGSFGCTGPLWYKCKLDWGGGANL